MISDIEKHIQDLTHLNWDHKLTSSYGTGGCFLKSTYGDSKDKIFYKLSNYDSYRGVFGHESVNELIVSRLLDVLHINHALYKLINADININGKKINTWLCASKNFMSDNEDKIAFEIFYDFNKKDNESPFDFCIRMGWQQDIYNMILADYLICNRDRHGANIEVLTDGKNVRLAPLFDNGVSLLFSCYSDIDNIKNFDVMQDLPTNNYLLSKSLEKNLSFVPSDYQCPHLQEEDIKCIMSGLEGIIPSELIDKIKSMIWQRWNNFICSSN